MSRGFVIIGTPEPPAPASRTSHGPGHTVPIGEHVRMAHRAQHAEHRATEAEQELARIRTWLYTPAGTADRYAEALGLIARAGCRKYTGDRQCPTQLDRTRDATYTADRWCDPCIAADALAGVGEVAA